MSEMIDRVAKALGEFDCVPPYAARLLARAAIEAMRDFNTEDFTQAESAGIRRLIDDALAVSRGD